LVYIASQLAGATLGALALKAVFPAALWESGKGGTPLLAHGMSTGKGVLLEALLTAFLVFVVYGVAVDERGSFAKIAGLPIGLVLTFDILAAGPLTGAAMNPARAFGPALVYGDWTNWWVYWIGPIGGAVVAAAIYWFAFLGGRERLVAMRKSQHPIGGPDDADTAIGVSEGVDIPGE
jgi:aquaporin Z